MKCGSERLVENYERGMVTAHELASRIVEETAARPTAETVVRLPLEAVKIIRAQAAQPAGTRWLRIWGGMTGDAAAWEAAEQHRQQLFVAGLAFWREYFASVAEDQT